MFHKIFEFIKATLEPSLVPIGDTGYLDKFPWMGVHKGVDAKGRPFFVMPVETVASNRYGPAAPGEKVFEHTHRGMFCVFKRYSDPDSTVWVTANSHEAGQPAKPILDGAIRDPSNGNVEEMLLRVIQGETVEFRYEGDDYFDAQYIRTSRLLTPEEVEDEKSKQAKQE